MPVYVCLCACILEDRSFASALGADTSSPECSSSEQTTPFHDQQANSTQLRKHRIDMVFFSKLASLFRLLFRLNRQHLRQWLFFLGMILFILVNTVVVSQTGSVIGGFYTYVGGGQGM
jgi:hypothetical protein